MRVLQGSDVAVASPVFVAADGETPTDCDTTPTVAVTRDDGTVLTAPTVTGGSASDGQYSAAFVHGSHTSRVDWLTVTWTGLVGGLTQVFMDTVEVVGGFYVTINELRNIRGLEDAVRFPTALLRDTRDEFEQLCEDWHGGALVPRYGSGAVAGCNGTSFMLPWLYPRSVISADATDTAGTVTAFTVTNWKLLDYGAVVTDGDTFTGSTYGERNITFRVSHGLDRPSAPIVRACKLYVQWQLFRDGSQVGRDIRQASDPSGFSTTYSLPDWDAGRPTGIGEIDTALCALGRRAPAVA